MTLTADGDDLLVAAFAGVAAMVAAVLGKFLVVFWRAVLGRLDPLVVTGFAAVAVGSSVFVTAVGVNRPAPPDGSPNLLEIQAYESRLAEWDADPLNHLPRWAWPLGAVLAVAGAAMVVSRWNDYIYSRGVYDGEITHYRHIGDRMAAQRAHERKFPLPPLPPAPPPSAPPQPVAAPVPPVTPKPATPAENPFYPARLAPPFRT